jgi:pyrimidine-nucleoside phosphorylase
MNVPEILERKRDGHESSAAEIQALIGGLLEGRVPEYQIAAWLMAVLFRGMTPRETAELTRVMLHSGDVLSWDDLPGPAVDKHSTGGVGDKISIPLAPAVAACGAWIPMVSGRGLGHTGGTLDKLESIPGLRTDLDVAAFRDVVRRVGFAIVGASARLAPADARLYALRDVTGTVPSVPLITASILSKKLAAGVRALVLDVKTGTGAFLRSEDEARSLASSLVGVAKTLGCSAAAYLTSMDQPLGRAVGNALEIRESIDVLEGRGPKDVAELVEVLGGAMLETAGIESEGSRARERVRSAIESGTARERFAAWVAAQGGDARALETGGAGLPCAPIVREARAARTGRVVWMDAREIGYAANTLGAGRTKVGDRVDPRVGFVMNVKLGDDVRAGQALAQVHAANEPAFEAAASRLVAAIRIEDAASTAPAARAIVLDRITE